MPDQKHYWVYIPNVNEEGTVVLAESFKDAFKKGCYYLEPDPDSKVQVHELGEGQEFYTDEDEDE